MKGIAATTAAVASALKLSTREADRWFRWLMEESSKMEVTTSVANLPHNKHLNRWHNVLPADHTRVVLSPKVRPNTDYINANHVIVPESGRAYILSQGPLEETVPDFWAMIWQQNTRAIVMLCKTVEGGMCKCSHYWPVNPSHASNSSAMPLRIKEAGLEIKLLDTRTDASADARIRTLEMTCTTNQNGNGIINPSSVTQSSSATTEVRTVVQYHFQDWPDFGVPATPDKFLNFLRVVNRDHPSLPGRPNVVHCSAGIGRSGTFCLVDSALEKFGSTDTLSQQSILNQEEVLQMLVRMRTQRDGQVQTSEQLRFALEAIAVAITEWDSSGFTTDPDQVGNDPEDEEVIEAVSENEDDVEIEEEEGGKPQNSSSPESAEATSKSPANKEGNGVNSRASPASEPTAPTEGGHLGSRKRASVNGLTPEDEEAAVKGSGQSAGGTEGGTEDQGEDQEVKPTNEKRKRDC